MAEEEEVQSIVAMCEKALLAPDGQVTLQSFLEHFPVGTISRVLQAVCSNKGSQHEASTIIRGITRLTEGPTASTDALKTMLLPAQHALAAGSPHLRVLGCDILSAWLQKQQAAANITQPVSLLIHMLEDSETDVAAAAASALQWLAVPPERLQQWLGPEAHQGLLEAALISEDATVRSRVLALTVTLAASSPHAAGAVLASGVLDSFLRELANGDDLLARLAALEQLLELAGTTTVPPALRARVLPHVLQLLDAGADPALQQAAIPAAARLLRHGEEASQLADFIAWLSAALQADDTSREMEAAMLDAAHTLSHSAACRAAVATSALLRHAAGRALGAGAPDDVCISAMHVLASVEGAELLTPTCSIQEALLPAAAEQAVRQAVYDASQPSQHPERGPAQRVLELLHSPFPDRKVPAYRMCTALAARQWFALEVCQHAELMSHVCDAKSESGGLCIWRFGMLQVLQAAARVAVGGSALALYAGRLHEAVSKGPYGVEQGTGPLPDVVPQIAVASRPG